MKVAEIKSDGIVVVIKSESDLFKAIKLKNPELEKDIMSYIIEHPLVISGLSPNLNHHDFSLAMTIAEHGSIDLLRTFLKYFCNEIKKPIKLAKKSLVRMFPLIPLSMEKHFSTSFSRNPLKKRVLVVTSLISLRGSFPSAMSFRKHSKSP